MTDTSNLYRSGLPATGGGNVANSAITDEATPTTPDTVFAHISVDAASVAEGGVDLHREPER